MTISDLFYPLQTLQPCPVSPTSLINHSLQNDFIPQFTKTKKEKQRWEFAHLPASKPKACLAMLPSSTFY